MEHNIKDTGSRGGTNRNVVMYDEDVVFVGVQKEGKNCTLRMYYRLGFSESVGSSCKSNKKCLVLRSATALYVCVCL